MATLVTGDFTTNSYTLPYTDSNDDQDFRCLVLDITATLTGAGTVIVPAIQKPYIVMNNSVGGYAVTVKVSGQTGISVPNGAKVLLYNNGTDVGTAVTYLTSLTLGSPLGVASGGTGLATTTAYGLIAAGTTATGNFQQVSGTGTSGQVLTSNGASALPTWQNAVSLSGNNAFTGANTFYNATGQTFAQASTNDGIIVQGRAGGSSSYRVTFTTTTLSASRTVTLPDGGGNYTLGYINAPAVGTKTTSYTLATADVGKYVQVGTSGSITIPDATFSEGDVISIFNNTTGSITITCTITTAYIAGTDSDKATMTLATRGVATILFISGTVCVVTGNVT